MEWPVPDTEQALSKHSYPEAPTPVPPSLQWKCDGPIEETVVSSAWWVLAGLLLDERVLWAVGGGEEDASGSEKSMIKATDYRVWELVGWTAGWRCVNGKGVAGSEAGGDLGALWVPLGVWPFCKHGWSRKGFMAEDCSPKARTAAQWPVKIFLLFRSWPGFGVFYILAWKD